MKTLTTILMLFAIMAGLVLALTPFVADKFFPIPENIIRQAKPEAAAMALKRWFNDSDALFSDVQAINKSTANGATAWFSFSVGRAPVEKYIIKNRLLQLPLTEEKLEKIFFSKKPPASWWQPDGVKQETYFTGENEDRIISLIYNPKTKRGVLVASSDEAITETAQ